MHALQQNQQLHLLAWFTPVMASGQPRLSTTARSMNAVSETMQQKYKSTGQVIINQTHLSNLGNITQRGVITSQKLFICHHLCSQHVTGCHDNPVILLAELLNQPSLTCTWGEEASLTLSRKTCWNVGFTGIHVTRFYLCLNDLLFWSTVKSTIIRKDWLCKNPKEVWNESPVLFFFFMRCDLCLAV